ncbi:unnamed protein product [Schistosoma margrebowiei]|uniref:Uncharacterized protein n=1 Tax=Schistosoma margrebowiei TaxID=48269 RepID=A0A183MFZ5_9TREM|nr:unnamed protein product [Schistosoma margrebowiei]
MVVGGSRQETQDPDFVLLGTRQQSVPVILRELVLSGGFDPMSPSFTAFHHESIPKYVFDNNINNTDTDQVVIC